MPLFEYQAFNSSGKAVHGVIDAPSRAAAYERVRQQGLYPSRIREESDTAGPTRTNPESLAFALVQLATLLRAGMPLPQAIDSLVSQVPDRALQRGLARVRVRLQEGTPFAEALAENPVFGPLLGRLVQAGATVGTLEVLLEEYAGFIERGQEYRQKLAGALMYPAVIMTASVALVGFVLTNVTPTLSRIYGSFHMPMPLLTRILLGISAAARVGAPWAAAALAVGIFAWLRVVPRTTRDGAKLRLPVFGTILTWTQVARWCRTLALLHQGGVPLVRALQSSRAVVENAALAAALAPVEKAVERGESLGGAMRRVGAVPELVARMADTGEKSGELAGLLVAAATFFEKEADRRLSTFIRLLEPGMILIMGAIVGFIVMAVLLPIFDIHELIH